MVNAVAPMVDPLTQSTPPLSPAEDLVASIPSAATARIALSQADLNAMGTQLTAALGNDETLSTFAWTNAPSGRSGLMTPFRASTNGDTACRMVSVEITDGPRDVILLADACLQDGAWVFLTPRAGEAL